MGAEMTESVSVSVIGFVAIAVGVITVVLVATLVRRSARKDVGWWGKVDLLPPGDVDTAPSGAPIAVRGIGVAPQTANGPLTDPFDSREALWWRCVSTEHWEEQVPVRTILNGEAREELRWEHRTRELSREETAMPFQVADGAGAAWVNPQELRIEDIGRIAAEREESGEADGARRGLYVQHTCEYVPAGVDLVVSGRARSTPSGVVIGADSELGLRVSTGGAGLPRHERERAAERERVAAVGAAARAR
jgi:hypothetical protein